MDQANMNTLEVDQAYLACQTFEIGEEVKGETRARRCVKYPELVGFANPDVRTAYDVYEKVGVAKAANPFLGKRTMVDGKAGPFEWLAYGDARTKWINWASGLKELGVNKGDRIGIFSINRPEWILADAAAHHQSFVPVALYATLGANAVEFVVAHAEISVIMCDGKNLDKVLAITGTQLRYVVVFDKITKEEHKEKAKAAGIELMYVGELEERGKAHPHPATPPAVDDLYTIMYTSGSTGNPKGVMLTQGNVLAEVLGAERSVNLGPDDVHLSYLPLAHSFERVIALLLTSMGAQVGFWQGNIVELMNDIGEIKPTFLIGAPRVFQRIHDKIQFSVTNYSWWKRTLFGWGIGSKIATIKEGGTTPIWDKVLFSNTKDLLGGRVKFIVSGSAPLDPNLADFLKACFCCPVIQGYGLTENCAGATITNLQDPTVGHVGAPLICNEMKLVDVPEMNYFSTDKPCPRGEICIRGHNVFVGYYKDAEKTKEDLKEDGWFHTGDVGRWNESGTLTIIDRKKNIFKLSQGEYVAAEYLEGVFTRSPCVGQVFVYGDSFHSFLVAVVVPDYDVVIPLAQQLGVNSTDHKVICESKAVNEAVLKSMNEVGKAANLFGFEFVKVLHLEPEAFNEDRELVTPTMKLRRPNLTNYYKPLINTMYEEYKKAHPDA